MTAPTNATQIKFCYNDLNIEERGQMGKLQSELTSLGFQQNRATSWSRKQDIVQIVRSSETPKVRVMWREYWKDFLAIIFDYSEAGGPICIVPSQEFFNSPFVIQKRKKQTYVTNKYYWSQRFKFDDEMAQLVLKYENRWDILGGQKGEVIGWHGFSKKPHLTKPPVITTKEPREPPTIMKEPRLAPLVPLKAFQDKYLLQLYCNLIEELRERRIVWTGNLVADYGEKVVADRLNLKLSVRSKKGYDAIDEKSGATYQIKSRQLTKHNGASSRQLGVIRDLDQQLFDF